MSKLILHDKQKIAAEKLKGPAVNIMLVGGARSGKTTLLIEKVIIRSVKYPGSRHLIARLRNNHARTTIWHESLIPALKRISKNDYTVNKQDQYIEFANGSEIWVGGFDDADRVEKLLGHEYSTIYLNEISQIGYTTVQTSLSRLAQNIPGLSNKAYYDCNPPSPMHWAHKVFIEKKDPVTGEKLERPELYDYSVMNPVDNKHNLAEGYIENFLETLSDRAKRRFLYGEWVKSEGNIYEGFTEDMIVNEVPQVETYTVGLDFGLNMAAVLIGWVGETIYLVDDFGGYNYTSSQFNEQIQRKWPYDYIAYCDPAGGERIGEITNGVKADNAVEPGIDAINTKIANGQFFVHERCSGVLGEIWDYRRDDKERIIKENDHCLVGSTVVLTDHGYKLIKDVKSTDYVYTRNGKHKASNSIKVGEKQKTYVVKLQSGNWIKGTKDHKVLTENGWRVIDAIRYNDVLYTVRSNTWLNQKLSILMGWHIVGGLNQNGERIEFTTTTVQQEKDFMLRFGNIIIKSLFQKVSIFITKIKIHLTMILAILNYYLSKSTTRSILHQKNYRSGERSILKKYARLRKNGIDRKREENGTGNTEKIVGRTKNLEQKYVNTAVQNTKQDLSMDTKDSVLTTVNQHGEEKQESTMKKEPAQSAGIRSGKTNIVKKFIVAVPVRELVEKGKAEVYDINVDVEHEFIANGIVVHNCMDSMRYGVFTHLNKASWRPIEWD